MVLGSAIGWDLYDLWDLYGPGSEVQTACRVASTDEQAAVASLWRALVISRLKVAELGRDVGLA